MSQKSETYTKQETQDLNLGLRGPGSWFLTTEGP